MAGEAVMRNPREEPRGADETRARGAGGVVTRKPGRTANLPPRSGPRMQGSQDAVSGRPCAAVASRLCGPQ